MKFTLVLLLGVISTAFAKHVDINEFEDEFDVLFSDSKEEAEAAENLEKHEESMEKQNEAFEAGEATFNEELNEMSELSSAEIIKEEDGDVPNLKFIPGIIMPSEEERKLSKEDQEYLDNLYRELDENREAIPDSYDARAAGLVTVGKSQGNCGSCAATATLEVCLAKAGTPLSGLDIAEQQSIDCGYNANSMNGCNGAWPGAYEQFMASSGKQNSHEAQYPYQERTPNLQCQNNPTWSTGTKVKRAIVDYNCNAEKMKQLVYKYGAVSGALYAGHSNFFQYKSGIFQGCPANPTIDHAVIVVGYGTENGLDYWIIKNSHGTNWGENGFMKIRRGNNECSLENICSALECEASGTYATAPVAPPPPPVPMAEKCDISNLFGSSSITGSYQLRVTKGSEEFISKVTCTNSICTPSYPGPANACMYICGSLTC